VDVAAPPFVHRVDVRYLEVDQQGVVFNMWYLAYFDDALSAFLAAGGVPYTDMMAAGYDVQLVHSEVDWRGSLRFGDRADILVTVKRVGTTSLTLGFETRCDDRLVATGTTVYVVVATDGSGKREVPAVIRDALVASTSTG
jgi:acyl-CoA thioester hydrolase